MQLFKWHIISLPVILKPDYHQVSIVGMVVIAPIVEELLFRLNLRYRSVFISFILTLILYSIFVRIVLGLLPFYYLWESIGNIAIIMVISVFVNLFIRRFNKSLEWFWIKYFRLIFYSSAIIFGFMHLGNYWIPNYTIVLLSPFFLLPFMFAGLNLGYIRLRYGIIFSIVLHAFNNLMPYIFHYNFR
ncbi:MAG: CPBP family glutamic-type intramembrane protease [Bacteroidota bacterium]